MTWLTIGIWLLRNAPHLIDDVELVVGSFKDPKSPLLEIIKQDLVLLISNGDVAAIEKAIGIDPGNSVSPNVGDVKK